MKTVEITSDFAGYPNGKTRRDFTTGEEPDLANDYADMLIGKGLAREDGAAAQAKPAKTRRRTTATPKPAETAPPPPATEPTPETPTQE